MAAGLAAALLAALALPAGARVEQKNDRFCKVFSSDPTAGVDFEDLSRAEAEDEATLVRKLAKTGVPAKLKKDLRKVAKVLDRIADGDPATEVVADEEQLLASALPRFFKYVKANCDDAGSSGDFGDLSALPGLQPQEVCSLAPDNVIEAALGAPIGAAPDGTTFEGLGTNCIWETAEGTSGPQVKVEFNTFTYEGSAGLAKAQPGNEDIEVAGLDAVTYEDATGAIVIVVKLGDADETGLYVDAPDGDGAQAVAEAVVASLQERA